jgi:hypothetical protein
MAVTERPNGLKHTAGGDLSSGMYRIGMLIWNGSSTAGDDLIIKNNDGDVELELKSNGSSYQPVLYPFGKYRRIDGIETDVIDAGTVEYIFE